MRETRREGGEAGASPVKLGSHPPSGPTPSRGRKGTLSQTVGEQESTSSLASTAASATRQAEAEADLSRPLSFAELEKALYSQSHQLQQPENVTNARTHGEVTPTLQSTMVQRKKIEVAKQQLAKLKMQKMLEAKAKAARRGSKASTSTGKAPKPSSTPAAALSSRPSQSTQTSQRTTAVSKTQQQLVPKPQQQQQQQQQKQQQQPLMKAVVPGSKHGSDASALTQSKAPAKVEAVTRPTPTVRVSQADSAPSVSSASQTKLTKVRDPQALLAPNHMPHGRPPPGSTAAKPTATSQMAAERHPAQHQAGAKVAQHRSSRAVTTEKVKVEASEEEHGGTWKEKALARKKEVRNKEPRYTARCSVVTSFAGFPTLCCTSHAEVGGGQGSRLYIVWFLLNLYRP